MCFSQMYKGIAICICMQLCVNQLELDKNLIYRKRGKIRWAKLSRIPLMKFFTEKLLWWLTFKTLNQHHHTKLVQDSRENFHSTVENCEKRKSLAQQIFSCLQQQLHYICNDAAMHVIMIVSQLAKNLEYPKMKMIDPLLHCLYHLHA